MNDTCTRLVNNNSSLKVRKGTLVGCTHKQESLCLVKGTKLQYLVPKIFNQCETNLRQSNSNKISANQNPTIDEPTLLVRTFSRI